MAVIEQGGFVGLVVDLSNTPPPTEKTSVVTYPCEGTVGALPRSYGEDPSPFPGKLWGQPVYVAGDWSLKVESASITGPLGDVSLVGILRSSGVTSIVPEVLSPLTIYTVNISGTSKSGPFTKTFRFQTGPA